MTSLHSSVESLATNAPPYSATRILISLCLALMPSLALPHTVAFGGDDAQRQDVKVSLDKCRAASKQLEELFTSKRRESLSKLIDSGDTMVALHASWELAKGDSKQVDKFVDQLQKRLKVNPPNWWRESVGKIRVYKNNCHFVPDVDSTKLTEMSRLSHDRYAITATPGTAGFRFKISVRDQNKNAELWKGQVWAAGRTFLAGRGVHRIEMVVSGNRLFVFGTESHGAYVEGFRLDDGGPVVRFCSCYWFNFSEKWKFNQDKQHAGP